MESNQAIVALSAEDIVYTKLDSMSDVIESNQHAESLLAKEEKRYVTIDVNKAMNNLANIGSVLRLAYAGSKGFPCAKDNVLMLSRYQSLIKNSLVTATSFTDASLSALKLHKIALTLAEKDKIEKALGILKKCSDLAGQMAKESDKLVQEATKLSELAETALVSATNDHSTSSEQKKKIEEMIIENKAQEAKLAKNIDCLYGRIEELREDQTRLATLAKDERSRQHKLNIILAITAPIQNVAGILLDRATNFNIFSKFKAVLEKKQSDQTENPIKEKTQPEDEEATLEDKEMLILKRKSYLAKNVDEKEMFILKLKSDLAKERMEAIAELAEIGERLKGLKVEDNNLDASILSLEMAIKSLGIIATTFKITKQFWEGVKKHCIKLTDNDILESLSDPDLKDDFILELKNSALCWLVLGKINYKAMCSLNKCDKETDAIMNDLPTKSDALQIIQNDADNIISAFKSEMTELQKEILP